MFYHQVSITIFWIMVLNSGGTGHFFILGMNEILPSSTRVQHYDQKKCLTVKKRKTVNSLLGGL